MEKSIGTMPRQKSQTILHSNVENIKKKWLNMISVPAIKPYFENSPYKKKSHFSPCKI
jgi:hypothetical protein